MHFSAPRRRERQSTFFAGGLQLSRDYTTLAGQRIESHPTVWLPEQPPVGASVRKPTALLYAGDTKVDKGFGLIPGLVEILSRDMAEWRFLIHANDRTAWDDLRDAVERLKSLALEHKNIELKIGRLSREAYEGLLAEADCVVCAYDPIAYAHKSSGLLWESIAIGAPVLVPANTWLANEAEAWGTGYVHYASHDPRTIADAFAELASRLQPLQEQARRAAETYRLSNGPEALFNQIGQLWAGRLMTAKLLEGLREQSLNVSDQSGAGWFEPEIVRSETVRWTGRAFEVRFPWQFFSPWRLRLEVTNFIDAEQLLNLRAEAPLGGALEVDARVENGIGQIVIGGERAFRRDDEIVVRLELPYVYRPKDDSRELGVQIGRILVGPSVSRPFSRGSELSSTIVETSVEWTDSGGGFYLGALTSGSVILDPAHDAFAGFRILTSSGPRAVRAIRLLVNGETVPLRSVGDGKGCWTFSADIPRSLIAHGGFRAQWDLIREPRDADDESVILEGLRFTQRRSEIVANAHPTPASTSTSMIETTQVEQRNEVAITLISIDEHLVLTNGYRHLDVSLYDVSIADDEWPQIKFKICVNNNARYLEFRESPDWPRMFRVWPGDAVDQYGAVLRIPSSETGELPKLGDRRDVRILTSLFESLELVVGVAVQKLYLSAEAKSDWLAVASSLASLAGSFQEPGTSEVRDLA